MRALRLSLIPVALTGALLSACTPPGRDGAPSPGRLYEFVEPDTWWKLDVPREWAPVRIELDGSVTPLPKKSRSTPLPAPSPLRDPLASEVVYAFYIEGSPDECEAPCPAGGVLEFAVFARPRLQPDPLAAARHSIDELSRTTRVTSVDLACPEGLECVAIEITTALTRTWVVMIDVPSQDRTYQIKASAPGEDWPRLEPTFRRTLAGFTPIRTSS